MTKRWRLFFALTLLPAFAGSFLWLVYFRFKWLPDQILYFRISIGILVFVLGIIFSIIFVTNFILIMLQVRRSEKTITKIRHDESAAHHQFLLRLDHELKNPLTSLQVEIANLGAILLGYEDHEREDLKTLQRLKEQTSRLSELVLQLRKLAELDTHPLEFTPIDLDGLLTDLVTEFQLTPAGMARQITLNLPRVPWPLPRFQADPDLLYLAIHNVLGNAIKYSRPGDSIQVRGYEDSDQIIIEIADTGPGIPDDEQLQVWKELFRGKMARGTPGSGLGLALVKAIIERQGGQVSLRSRINQGTIVTFRLPNRL